LKIEKLLNIGFKFFIGKGKGIRNWDRYFEDLLNFKAKNGKRSMLLVHIIFIFQNKALNKLHYYLFLWKGHTNIPLNYEVDPQLGRWANTCRKNYLKQMKGKCLSVETQRRLHRLKEIGFSFHVEMQDSMKKIL